MAVMNFTKMQGLGNDFVVVDCREKKIPGLPKKAGFICDRRFGAGCDQLIVIGASKKADYTMRIYNADGSEAQMCGNGIRCMAKYLWDRKDKKIRSRGYLEVETCAGIIRPAMKRGGMVEVDMGAPELEGHLIPSTFAGQVVNRRIVANGKAFRITAISMGNPHCVIFTDDVDKIPLEKYGRALECHDVFPERANVEFVQPMGRGRVKARVWERGAGATPACGTGACAVAVACVLNRKSGRKVKVELPGGVLAIEWTKSNRVMMTGPAVEVYNGQIDFRAAGWKSGR